MSNDFPQREPSKDQFLVLKLFPAAAFLWATVEHFQLFRHLRSHQQTEHLNPSAGFHRGRHVIKFTLIDQVVGVGPFTVSFAYSPSDYVTSLWVLQSSSHSLKTCI